MANTIGQDFIQPDVNKVVELFQLDLSPVTGNSADVYYFVDSTRNNAAVQWKAKDGSTVTYNPIDIQISGFEFTSSGTLPRPKVRVSNVTLSLLYYIKTFEDIVGATLTRYVTLDKYLSPLNKDAHRYPDVYTFIRKVHQSALYIEWELASVLDASGRKLPRRLVLRDTCEWEYPIFNETTRGWDVVNPDAVCPMWNFHLLKCDEFWGYDGSWSGWGWTTGSNWAITAGCGGVATHNPGVAGAILGFAQNWLNCWYTVHFRISNMTAGSFYIAFDYGVGESFYTNGYHRAYIQSPADNSKIYIYGSSDFNGTISGIFGFRCMDADGVSVEDPADDMCGKDQESCFARWHNNPMPFGGFPGVGRVRV